MIDTFSTLVLHVHFLGIQSLILPNNDKSVLLYFCRELDSADVPLNITVEQAKQLHNDLAKLFSSEEES